MIVQEPEVVAVSGVLRRMLVVDSDVMYTIGALNTPCAWLVTVKPLATTKAALLGDESYKDDAD